MSPHRDAELFTAALFASAPAGTLLVVSIAPNWAKPHFVTGPSGVIDYAVGTVDAYVRLTSIAKRPPRGKRAGDELTAAVFGIARTSMSLARPTARAAPSPTRARTSMPPRSSRTRCSSRR